MSSSPDNESNMPRRVSTRSSTRNSSNTNDDHETASISTTTAMATRSSDARRRVSSSTLEEEERPAWCQLGNRKKVAKSVFKNLPILHPYLNTVSVRRSTNLGSIVRAEQRVLQLLERTSGWRVYPRGPRKSYTTAAVDANTAQVIEEDANAVLVERSGVAAAAANATPRGRSRSASASLEAASIARVPPARTTANPMLGEVSFPADRIAAARAALRSQNTTTTQTTSLHQRRAVSLTLNDLTVYALLEVLDNYLHTTRRRNNGPNNRPTLPETPPQWEMPADVAILDQLQTMELFHCTGNLPESMNFLTKLQTLKLKSCHNLQLEQLNCRALKELDITDSEGVLPRNFGNLPQLERLKLYRIASSDANTNTIGKDWIRDIQQNYQNLKWTRSLKDLCLCSAGLSNDDLATLMVDVLCSSSKEATKFPNLRSIFIISNLEVTSFKPLLERFQQRFPTARNFVPPPLRVLSLTGTKIPKTVPEMEHILKFLKIYHEIGLFMMVKLPDTLRADVVQCVNRINHQLTINRAGGPVLLACREKEENRGADADEDSASSSNQHNNTRRRPVPLSLWPLILERAMNLEYVACYEASEDRSQSIRRRAEQVVARGEAVMRRVDHVVARARAILGNDNNNNNNGNGNGNGNNVNVQVNVVRHRNANANANGPRRQGENAPVAPRNGPLWGRRGRRRVVAARQGNGNNNNNNDTNDSNPEVVNWMEDCQAFSNRSRYDAVYHLLRNGPCLLATGESTPRCKRVRSYIPRNCKRVKLF